MINNIEEPETQAVEVDDEPQYNPEPDNDDGVVVVEPEIITIGRKNLKDDLRKMRSGQEPAVSYTQRDVL
jgi:hypothetical protein